MKVLLYILILFFVLACSSRQPSEALLKEEVEEGLDKSSNLPSNSNIEVTHHIFIMAVINDSIHAELLFDTGANELILDEKFLTENLGSAAPLGTSAKFTYGVGVGRLRTATFSQGLKLGFDNQDFPISETRIMPLDSMFAEVIDHRIDGIVGYDLFKNFLVDIDFDSLRMDLRTIKNFQIDSSFQKISYVRRNRKPLVRMELQVGAEEILADVLFDTGSALGLSLTNTKSSSHELFAKVDSLKCEQQFTSGLGGKSESCYGLLDGMKIGDSILVNNRGVELSKDDKGALGLHTMYDGILGLEVIKEFNVKIDQGEGFIYLNRRDWKKR